MRAIAITKRIFRQLVHDRRTLAMMLVAPCIVLWLLSVIFDTPDPTPRFAVFNPPEGLVEALENANAEVVEIGREEAETALRERRIDAIVVREEKTLEVTVEGSDPTTTKVVMKSLQLAQGEMMSNLAGGIGPIALKTILEAHSDGTETLLDILGPDAPLALKAGNKVSTAVAGLIPAPGEKPELDLSFLYGGPNTRAFDNFGPVLVGVLVFFFTFIVAGMSFVRERTTGTLERMLATPLRRHEIVLGYLLGFVVIVILQSTLIVTVSVGLLDMQLTGSFALLLLVVLLLAVSALSLGMFVSAFAESEFQVMQFIPIVVIPQVFFCGLFSIESMHAALQALGYAMPLTYAANAMREVMIRGGGLGAVAFDLLVLMGFAVVFLALNTVALRKLRRL